jgi:outer membrane protein assembly factor BamE (lipoprotein component of BamABCDE complex)
MGEPKLFAASLITLMLVATPQENGVVHIATMKLLACSLRLGCCLALMVFMAGCMSMGRRIDQQAADSIQIGKTTRAQVSSRLGSPDEITRDGRGNTIFAYRYFGSQVRPETFIPFVGPLVGGSNMQRQEVLVTFGSNGIVKDFSSTQGSSETGMNLGASRRPDTPELDTNMRDR